MHAKMRQRSGQSIVLPGLVDKCHAGGMELYALRVLIVILVAVDHHSGQILT